MIIFRANFFSGFNIFSRTEVREAELLFRIKALEADLERLRSRGGDSMTITDLAVNSEFENRCEKTNLNEGVRLKIKCKG